MGVLKVKADDMAHLEAVLQRSLLLQLCIVFAELLEVKSDAAVEGHGLLLDLLPT